MTIEETITQLHSIIDNAKSFYSDDEDSEIWRADVAACEMAIAALREKQESEKGCELCNRGKPIKAFTIIPNRGLQYGTSVIADRCPKCGRKLKEDVEE